MTTKNLRLKKIQKIAQGTEVGVIDLFAGCGGLSLGFHTEGFRMLGGVEKDPKAAESYFVNFHTNDNPILAEPRDIIGLCPLKFIQELYPAEEPQMLVDVIIGGPPCQAFARIGRAKLREVAQHPEAFKHDPRADLYIQYLRFVDELQPIALVMENVIDILNFGGQNIADEICHSLEERGYICRYTTLNAVYYGVPEMRERFFLIAFAGELNTIPDFPTPTHWIDLPGGYENARRVALSNVTSDHPNWVEAPEATPDLQPAVVVSEAIADLPPIYAINALLEGKLKRGPRKFDELVYYLDSDNFNDYAVAMRNWPSFENETGVYDHVIRYLPRDYAIFRRMAPGDQYPEAHEKAIKLFNERLREAWLNGKQITKGSPEYENLWKATVPPYNPATFPNRWRKMEDDAPARTLTAHLGKDSYSHIHYDSQQARTISVREAARLQSFPDGFKFAGAMNSAFRQIGNAVPPILARAIAHKLKKDIILALQEFQEGLYQEVI